MLFNFVKILLNVKTDFFFNVAAVKNIPGRQTASKIRVNCDRKMNFWMSKVRFNIKLPIYFFFYFNTPAEILPAWPYLSNQLLVLRISANTILNIQHLSHLCTWYKSNKEKKFIKDWLQKTRGCSLSGIECICCVHVGLLYRVKSACGTNKNIFNTISWLH